MARVGGKDKSLTPAVSIVVVAYQSGRHLETCLAALATQGFTDHEIILLDNASDDGAPQTAAGAHPKVRFVEAGSNLGFAAGVNRAAQLATGRWMALINPDAFADPSSAQAVAGAPGFAFAAIASAACASPRKLAAPSSSSR